MKPREQHLTEYRCVLGTQIPELNLSFLVKYSWMLSRANAFIKGRVNKRRQEKLNLSLASRETSQICQVKRHGSQELFTYLPQWANRRKTWTGNGKRTKSNWKVPWCGSEEPQLRSRPFRHKLYIQVLLRFSPMPSRALVSQCHLLISCCYSLAYII